MFAKLKSTVSLAVCACADGIPMVASAHATDKTINIRFDMKPSSTRSACDSFLRLSPSVQRGISTKKGHCQATGRPAPICTDGWPSNHPVAERLSDGLAFGVHMQLLVNALHRRYRPGELGGPDRSGGWP